MLITTVHKCEALTKLDFPGTPVVKIPCYQCKDRFDPWLKNKDPTCHSLVQFSCSVVSYSLRPHGLQRARPSCPSPTPGVYANSCPLSWWCHPTISSRFKKKVGGGTYLKAGFMRGAPSFLLIDYFFYRGGHGNPFQYSYLENLMDKGASWATVHGIAKSRTRLKWQSTHARTTLLQVYNK